MGCNSVPSACIHSATSAVKAVKYKYRNRRERGGNTPQRTQRNTQLAKDTKKYKIINNNRSFPKRAK